MRESAVRQVLTGEALRGCCSSSSLARNGTGAPRPVSAFSRLLPQPKHLLMIARRHGTGKPTKANSLKTPHRAGLCLWRFSVAPPYTKSGELTCSRLFKQVAKGLWSFGEKPSSRARLARAD